MPQVSSSEFQADYAEAIYQLLHCAKNSQVTARELQEAVARSRKAWGDKPEAGFRSLLRAAGAFAKNNDGYFIRYKKDGGMKESEALPPATHLFVFPVPVEPRMRVAYSYMQGIFLKHLYTRYQAIPREVRQGWAEVICGEENSLPEADELWADFLKSGVAEDAIAVSAQSWTSSPNMGRRKVDDAFLSDLYLLGMARAIARRATRFQVQVYTMPAFRREDLSEELADRDVLKMSGDDEFNEFRSKNKRREWDTLQLYKWLESKSKNVHEFEELVEDSLAAIREASGREVSIRVAAQRLEELFREEFVPLVSKQEYTELAIPDLTRHLLLWELVESFSEPEAGKIVFMGWDLLHLRRIREDFGTPEIRGSLKFMEKNEPSKRGTELLARVAGFKKLEADIRLVQEEVVSSTAAPFELWNIAESHFEKADFEAKHEPCTVCGRMGKLSRAGILPENQKVPYDNPGPSTSHAKVCARCVQVWSLAPISTAGDDYAIVEVPVENFLELFALYESLEGINRLETLKTLNKVSSLSVFPNKYLLLSRALKKGQATPIPQVAQYYLQLARQPHFLEKLEENTLEVIAAPQDRAKLAREVALTLSVLQRLPYYHANKSEEKVPAMSIINALDRGRPYEALYVAADRAHEAGLREAQAISGGVAAYDKKVEEFGEFFARRQKGAAMNAENFRDVGDFSDYLYSILEPIVRHEVRKSKSRVSGIARKYTTTIREDFPSMDTSRFEYLVSSYVEGVEIEELRNGSRKGYYMKRDLRELLYGTNDESESRPQNKRIDQELGKYHENTRSKRGWKSFVEAVERRTLSLLLFNVDNVKSSS